MIRFTPTKARQRYLLEKYISYKIDLTNCLNVLMATRGKNYFEDIGEYIIDNFLKSDKNNKYINLIKSFYKRPIKKTADYTGAAIFFLTSFLNRENLKKMFGDGIYHNEFGEGFDEEDGLEDYSCLSYFIEINDDYYHITYDNRGTSVEVPTKGDPKKVLEDIKELVDLFIEKS